jgi:hypothetical protein
MEPKKKGAAPESEILKPFSVLKGKSNGAEIDLLDDLPWVSALATDVAEIPEFIRQTRTRPAGTLRPIEDDELAASGRVLAFVRGLSSSPGASITLAKGSTVPKTVTAPVARELFDELRKEGADETKLAIQLEQLFDNQAKLNDSIEFVRQFSKDHDKARRYEKTGLFLDEHVVDLKKGQPFTIKVEANPTYSKIADIDAFQKANTRTIKQLNIEPKEGFHFRKAVGAVYSFVDNPKFEVKTTADGTMTIAKKSSDSNEFGIAAMGNFYPDMFWEDTVEPFFQVGYALEKNSSGFLIGLGFSGWRDMNLSAGFIYQQVRALGDGLSVGQQITKAEDLVTRNPYKGGIYVQIGFQF